MVKRGAKILCFLTLCSFWVGYLLWLKCAWFCPSTPLSWDPSYSAASSSRVPNIGGTWSCWTEYRGDHRDAQRAGAPLLWRQAVRVGAVQGGEEKAPGRPYSTFLCLKGYRRAGEGLLTRSGVTGQRNGFRLKEGRLRSAARKKFVSVRVVRQWSLCPERLHPWQWSRCG